jgi:hypothetical protein
MPFDAAASPRPLRSPAPRRIVIVMPWRGRNAEIIRAREARPKLPPHWGDSLGRIGRTRSPEISPEPSTFFDELRAAAVGASVSQRLMLLLAALAARCDWLPSNFELADLLDVAESHMSDRLRLLHRAGDVHVVYGATARQRALRIVATGRVLRSEGAPEWLVP